MKQKYIKKSACLMVAGVSLAFGWAQGAEIDVIATQTVVDPTLGVRVLNGSQTWTNDNDYILTDRVYVKDGDVLRIQFGTKIYGTFDDNGTPTNQADDAVGSLIITRGAQIQAEGTASDPIVFSSLQDYEARIGADTSYDADSVVGPAPDANTAGQWGGLLLLGNANVSFGASGTGNLVTNLDIEGFSGTAGADTDGDSLVDALEYGSDANYPEDLDDNSGTLRYVSIRHGGYEFAEGDEINGLTLGGVGSGTTIEFVEVYANQDDGIEFFGGNVSTRNLVMAFNQDDSFDIDQGHSGMHQFWFAVQNGTSADGGGEWDGTDGERSASLPLSSPQIYNMTLIGPGLDANPGIDKGNDAIHVEDFFNGAVYDSVLDDFTAFAIRFIDTANSTGGGMAFAHNTIGRFGEYDGVNNGSVIGGVNQQNLLYGGLTGNVPQDGNSDANTDPLFTEVTRSGNDIVQMDPRPQAGSPLLVSNGATLQGSAPVTVDYRGAVGSDNWASGWTAMAQNGELVQDVVVGVEITDCGLNGTTFRIDFTGAANTTYGVKGSDDLVTFDLDPVISNDGLTTDASGVGFVELTVDPATVSRRFFRIELP